MNSHSEKEMDDLLRDFITSGEIDGTVAPEIEAYFLSNCTIAVPANVRVKVEHAFMAARFKAIIREKHGLITKKQADTMTLGGYLSFVRSTLKIAANIAAEACHTSEQALLSVENVTLDIFKAPLELLIGILDGFSLPLDRAVLLLRNTLAIAKEKEGDVAVFPRADKKTESIVGAFEAGLLAIAKASGKTTTTNIEPALLSKISEGLAKLGRSDLLS